MDYCEVLGLLRKWQAPTNQRCDPDPKRNKSSRAHAALAGRRTAHQLCAVGLAVWKQQGFVQWIEEGTSFVELYEWWKSQM